jgi:acyl-CoA synthetase (AMP-forming)/AMP-acid ligase II
VSWIDRQLEGFGAQIASYESERAWTYSDFVAEVRRFKALILAKLTTAPAVIAIQIDDTTQCLASILAIADLRQIALPLSSALIEAEQVKQKQIAGAAWTLHADRLQPYLGETVLSELAMLLSDRGHAGLILFSSGTSGEPKGMLHDLDALLDRYKRVRPREDRTIQLLLADHIGGLDSGFRTLFAGSTLIVPKARTAEAVGAAIEQYSANILPASPTFLNLMLLAHISEKCDCSSLEIIAYGAEPMPAQLLERLGQAFSFANFQQKFGTSETGAIRIKSQGRGSLYFRIDDSDVEWKVLEGELWLKASSRILGYLNADESSLEADGWYRTGDLVAESDGGFLRIIGRASQLINVGGLKVHPAELEQIINEIEGVVACRVYGKPAAVTGQMVACTIVSSSTEDLRSWKRLIRNHCRGRVAAWKIPASVSLSETLDVNHRLKSR